MLTYEQAIAVTHEPLMLTAIIATWLMPLILYLIVGIISKGRSASGATTSKMMLCYPNFYYAVIVWGIFQGAFMLLLIFPIYLKLV